MSPGVVGGLPEYPRDSVMLYFYNAEGEILRSFPRKEYPSKVKSGYLAFSWDISIYQNNDNWQIYNAGDDTLYRINSESLVPLAIFDLGPSGQTCNEYMNPSEVVGSYGIAPALERNHNWLIEKITVTMADINEYRPGQWGGTYDIDESYFMVNKSSGSAQHIKFTDDLTGLIPDSILTRKFEFLENKLVYQTYQAHELHEWLHDLDPEISVSDEMKIRQDFIRESITEESNPVVFRYKLNKSWK